MQLRANTQKLEPNEIGIYQGSGLAGRMAMKHCISLLTVIFFALFTPSLIAAPLVEVDSDVVRLSLSPYVDVLEDKTGDLTIDDVVSDRYAFQFAPASMTELYFGYTTSAYWLRFTVENQRDEDIRLILEASPADIDYVDLYVVDSQTDQLHKHIRLGSAMPYSDRAYSYPISLFDLNIAPHAAYTYFVRAESDKAVNVQLSLSTPREYMTLASEHERWQGILLGGLLILALVNISLFAVYRFKAFLWSGLTLLSVAAIQAAWNGYLLPFFDSNEALLDHQIMTPVFLAVVFSALYAQSLLKTRKRVPWQHHLLTGVGMLGLIGVVATWFVSPHASALAAAWLASFGVVFIFAVALHANMDEHVLARRFIAVRVITASVVLIAIFNANGLLPQGAFTSWGVAAAVIVEALVMTISMVWHCVENLRDKFTESHAVAEKKVEVRSLVNLSDICHELRTPISGVLGMTDLLLTSNVTDQQRNQIKTIHKSGLALLDVTNRLSDLSSIERGNIDINNAPFELIGLVESCIENCRSRAEVGGVELIYHIDSSITGFVKGDQEKLQHIIVNLLQFALRNVEQGEVVLSVRVAENSHTLFEIHSGQNTLMERNHPARTRELHSSDHINLTIAEQYIQLMGGMFNMQLFANGGAIIEFSLQLDAHFSQTRVTDDALSLQGRRMLVVDDNVTYCSIIEQQAVQWGMTVQSAHGGMEALAILRSHTTVDELFDIALIDFEMPGMDGLELAAHIRADQKINSEKMIMMMLTGVSRAPSKPILENAGIHRALYKPLSGKSLKQALQSALMR